MADEIANANVITVVGAGPHGPWTASIGPAGPYSLGMSFAAWEPTEALEGLVARLRIGWCFDPTWRPKTR
jgi:hypothetical protein